MRKLRILAHISLDGVVQHENDEHFTHGDWTTPYRSPAGLAAVLEAQGSRFDLLLGRRTYDLWAGYWPTAGDTPMAKQLNTATKYVATHRPDSLGWGPAQGLGTDALEGVRRLKATAGPDLVLWGSTSLTSELLVQGLADELVLLVYPVVLGPGKRLFSDRLDARELAFVGSQATPSGVLITTYRYVGALRA
ncbi:dihydrofolate reductase family protein [Hymenobacter ruricola]|uniref:Dihydrofolate reductase family protein n=1 Tax=Hymenobacter ruricola TaxID=2791023 RepID=A0ABS0IAT8_9BACT|nr:dihydrofolate reductase family protein [Hymenobacter ruricola]MBF9224080.1 dihydrofolate reductase family protein [Hymenobacter ruricola]